MKNKAIELFCRGRYKEALEIFKCQINEGVEDADVFCHYAILLEREGDFGEAIIFYRKALELNPGLVPALANLGNQLKNSGYLSTSALKLQEACNLEPKNSLILSNYANVLTCMGRHKESFEYYKKSLDIMPGNFNALSNWLLSLNYTETFTSDEIFKFHQLYSVAMGEIHQVLPGYSHSKLRIGYVSGDFKRHSVAYFIEGILHFHDRSKFEIYCYSDVVKPDVITQKIKDMDLTYRNIKSLSDEETHKLILADEIDVLIDLGAHTGKRLKVFGYRSAPIQISYLGYCNTTGLKNIDLRIVDSITDNTDSPATEKLIRLNRPFLAFCPPEDSKGLLDSPCLKNGYITFGSFNNLPKLTDEVFRLWIRILKQTPNSRLLLKTRAFIDDGIKESILKRFTSRGVAPDRIILKGYQSTLDDHLVNYHKIDIALDPFPYNGTTTTCEALHMGVPVICLEGKKHVSRVSASILEFSNLKFLLAKNKNEYVSKAVKLAEDFESLNSLHHKVRPLFHNSQVCNSKHLTDCLENLYLEYAKRPAEASLF